MDRLYDTAVVGGGIAGYTAALTAKHLLLDLIWFGEQGFGDKLRLAEKVTNFPAVMGRGADFAAALQAQKEAEGIPLTQKRIDGVYRTGDLYTLTAGEDRYTAKTVILATGVETRTIRGEREFLGRGVSYCAVCDGALYRGKRIAAVLSSPRFEEEAVYLAKFAAHVHCVCLYPDPKLSGEKIAVDFRVPRAVEGTSHAERLVFDDGEIQVDGVFFLKNSAPPESLVYGLKTKDGHVLVDRALSAGLPGLFAAGDVTGRPYQYAKAAGEGCVAAHSARAYLNQK